MPTSGVGLGRGTIDPEKSRPPVETWTTGVPLGAVAVAALLLASVPVQAGNYGDNTGWGGGGDVTAPRGSSTPSEMLGGISPQQLYQGQVEAIAKREERGLGGFFNGLYRSISGWGDGFFGGPTSLGQVNYSAPASGVGYSSFNGGGMDPNGRGSGVEGPSPW